MNSRIKTLWLTALRDGSYTQTQGVLKDVGERSGHCCLGVLCDLYGKENGVEWVAKSGYGSDWISFLSSEDVLPQDVVDWAGVTSSNPIVNVGIDEANTLADVNDNGRSFTEIADIIEEQL